MVYLYGSQRIRAHMFLIERSGVHRATKYRRQIVDILNINHNVRVILHKAVRRSQTQGILNKQTKNKTKISKYMQQTKQKIKTKQDKSVDFHSGVGWVFPCRLTSIRTSWVGKFK